MRAFVRFPALDESSGRIFALSVEATARLLLWLIESGNIGCPLQPVFTPEALQAATPCFDRAAGEGEGAVPPRSSLLRPPDARFLGDQERPRSGARG